MRKMLHSRCFPEDFIWLLADFFPTSLQRELRQVSGAGSVHIYLEFCMTSSIGIVTHCLVLEL